MLAQKNREESDNDFEDLADEFDDDRVQDEPDAMLMDDAVLKQRLEKEVMFWTQGVGSVKNIGGIDVYVKSEHCEESLRDIIKNLKQESPKLPLIKHILSKWQFLAKDLLPVLIFHDKDKKLSFLTIMLLVQLTEQPAEECDPTLKKEFLGFLVDCKQAMLEQRVVATLVKHISDCIQTEERTTKHNQLVELIVVLFKQILSITGAPSLQKHWIVMLHDEQVMEVFLYLTNDFQDPLNKKLAMHFLEINFHLFKNYQPQQIINPTTCEQEALLNLQSIETARVNKLKFVKSLRHAKFGTQLMMKREDGSNMMVSNIYQTNIDTEGLGKKQQRRPGRSVKDEAKVIEATEQIVNDAAKDETDIKLIAALHTYLTELLANSYCALVEELFLQVQTPHAILEDNDRYHLLKIQTFVMEVCRLQAQSQHQKLVQEQSKLKVKVPFKISISQIGVSLQYSSFDFLFSSLFRRVLGKKEVTQKPIKDKEFHAALKMLLQFLLIIQDMASCTDKESEECEKNRKNAQILKAYVFRHELWKVMQFAFAMYNSQSHTCEFLQDAILLNHVLVQMLEDYSKGKVLTVKTQRTVLRKKQQDVSGSENEQSDEEHCVERQFNFIGELSVLVDYEVISKYVSVLSHPSLSMNSEVLTMVSAFFKRIMFQFKQPWIFFTLETLSAIDQFIKKQKPTNPLMKGIAPPTTVMNKRIEIARNMLNEVLTAITSKFVALQATNPLLAIEILFKFTSQNMISQALSNYNGMLQVEPVFVLKEASDDEAAVSPEEQPKSLWTHSDDLVLIENYPKYKDLNKRQCFSYLAELLEGKQPRECHDRYKELNLKKLTQEEAIARSMSLQSQVHRHQHERKLVSALQKMCLTQEFMPRMSEIQQLIEYLSRILEEADSYDKQREDAILFGHAVDLMDLRHNEDQLAMRIVPSTREEFKLLANPKVVSFMQSFGITASQKGFLKLELGSKDSFRKTLDYFKLQVMPRVMDEVVQNGQLNRDKLQAFA